MLKQRPLLKTIDDWREFVKASLKGTGVHFWLVSRDCRIQLVRKNRRPSC